MPIRGGLPVTDSCVAREPSTRFDSSPMTLTVPSSWRTTRTDMKLES
jgi:hypothetical protein